jgi:hypothetical protein
MPNSGAYPTVAFLPGIAFTAIATGTQGNPLGVNRTYVNAGRSPYCRKQLVLSLFAAFFQNSEST